VGPGSCSLYRPDSTARKRPQILIVEDSRADVFLIRESLGEARVDADLYIVHDGEKAVRFFEQVDRDPATPPPDLVILDINLPKRPGSEVLRQMRQSTRSAKALVVVVTSSDSERDRQVMTNLGAAAYFCKPSDYQKFMKLGELAKGLLEKARE
jgi:DNA-binding response OmpR family regulator